MTVILRTRRLSIRLLRETDLDAVHGMLSDPAVMAFYPRTLTRVQSREWIAKNIRRYREHGAGLWGLELIESGGGQRAGHDKIIGQAGLVPLELAGRDELCLVYIIARDHWLKGYATEAAIACRDYALDELGRERVISAVRPEHAASRRVLEKAGLKETGDECEIAGFRHLLYAMEK